MSKFLIVTVLAAVAAVSLAGLAMPAQPAEATEVDLGCEQTLDPSGAGTKGEVTCSLSISDLPGDLDDFSLSLVASYVDVDGDGAPSPGDQLQCITVDGSTLPEPISFCRPDEPEPTPISPPA